MQLEICTRVREGIPLSRLFQECNVFSYIRNCVKKTLQVLPAKMGIFFD